MKSRAVPPARADHAGSLLRSQELLLARQTGDPSALARAEDEAVRAVVRIQEDSGLTVVTDGEQRRAYWNFDLLGRLGNVEFVDATPGSDDLPRLDVHGPVHREQPLTVPDFAFLRAVTGPGCTAKQTLPSPTYLQGRGRVSPVTRTSYPEDGPLYADTAAAYRAELAELAEAGCSYVQFDDPGFGFLCDPVQREQLEAATGRRTGTVLKEYAQTVTDALRDRPQGLTVTLHTCRGNFRGQSFARGGYEPVAEVLFNETDVDGYYLEYDTEAAGGFEPLRYLPSDKFVVLGLVSTRDGRPQDKDTLKRRINEASRFVPLERLALGPQCGFCAMLPGNPLTARDQADKLRLVAETAAEIWR
ncbi:5-methyltetrahydropteroyltriglutamate--homocysteine S-methyltransferase [Streptomyces sp. NPDC090493]|uniref:5-methyltetrahydropteroyltriglutamate-- homocysteine S-methyltransferase n=1 Tax=Streptomyces sp. NPDC090493 TaxID=3365964 RepID=UPI0038253FFE